MGRRPIIRPSATREDALADLLDYTETQGECLIWKGAVNTDGYAHMRGNVKVHRLVWKLANNADPTGSVVRHTCDTPLCVNPKHLIIGSVADNANDKFVRDRQPRVVTKEIVFRVREMLKENIMQKDIAKEVGINPRRVSDIKYNLYNEAGKFSRKGE